LRDIDDYGDDSLCDGDDLDSFDSEDLIEISKYY
jgi:hypothetical protein